jgi:hypothetical protein
MKMEADKKPEDTSIAVEARVWDRNDLIKNLKQQ